MGIAFLGYSHRSTGVYQTLRCLYAPSFRLAAFFAVNLNLGAITNDAAVSELRAIRRGSGIQRRPDNSE